MAIPIAASSGKFVLGALLLISSAAIDSADAAGFSTLHLFSNKAGDGRSPWSGLVADNAGNLYGTTETGGSVATCGQSHSKHCGTVFRLAPDGTETVLHSFGGKPHDGAFPMAGLVADTSGDLYGTTWEGGTTNRGTVFEILSDGSEHTLYSFGGIHGEKPEATLIVDGSGNLYGTTVYGGDDNCPDQIIPGGCGTVFRLAPDGKQKVLHAFAGGNDGNAPMGGLVMDQSGNLYGATVFGGYGNGNVFEIAADGTEKELYAFQGMPDGSRPYGSLVMDGAGNLYGTTALGGNSCGVSPYGCGTVFRLAPNGKETVLYAFTENCCDGIFPEGGVIADAKGNLYGTTYFGGQTGCFGVTCGTVFRLAPDGKETILHAFDGSDGSWPAENLLLMNGALYGTATTGGKCFHCGSVFVLDK